MKEKKEKKRPADKSKKPVNHLDFDALELAIVDCKLVTRDRMLVLNRLWRTTVDDKITLCTVLRVSGNDIALYDETLGQEFLFDIVKDVSIYPLLRIYDKTKIRKVSKSENLNEQILKLFEPDTKLNIVDVIENISSDDKSMENAKTALLDLISRGHLVMNDDIVSLSDVAIVE